MFLVAPVSRPVSSSSASGRDRTCRPRRAPGYSRVARRCAVRRVSVARVGFEPTRPQGLSLAAVPVRVPCHPAPLTGFEPAISTVTGWRAIQSLPKGVCPTPQSKAPGGSRTHSSALARRQASRYITGACVVVRSPGGVRTPHVTPRKGGMHYYITGEYGPSEAPGRSRTCAAVLPRRQAAVTSQGRSIQCPRQESNLVFNLRRVACGSGTPRGRFQTTRTEHLAGVEPATPVWKTGTFPATPQVLQPTPAVRPEGLEPSHPV